MRKLHTFFGEVYEEVDRKAKVGDKVFVSNHTLPQCNGFREVKSKDTDTGYIYFNVSYLGECGSPFENYTTLKKMKN